MVDVSRKIARAGAWGAVLALSALATAGRGWAAPVSPEVPATRAEDRAIFDVAATREWLVDAYTKGEPWTPTLGDVQTLEDKLPGYLRGNYKNPDKEPLWKRAPGYKRQYLGLTSHHQRVIYANFFCGVPTSRVGDWHSVAVRVHDGGDCYFSVFYDVKRGTFSHLDVNGEA
jgi:hypothetical protein